MTATTIERPAAATAPVEAAEHKRTLRGAVLSELKRLNRKTFTGVGAALIAFFSVMTTSILFLATDTAGGGPMGGATIALDSADGLVAGLSMSADLFGIIALALWAAAVASDYATGWIRVMVQAEPRRWRLLGGKLTALVGLTVVGTLMAVAITAAISPALAAVTGVSTALWYGSIATTLFSGWLNLLVPTIVWGLIGFAVATVTRSAVVAIAGGIGYMMVVEGMLGLVAESATTYLPGSVLSAIASGGTASLAYGPALVLAGVYGLVAIGIAVYVFHRRDIVA